MPALERDRVAVCICTCRRPERLTELLERLRTVADDAVALATIGVVVVDDDPARSAAGIAATFDGFFEHGLEYRSTASGNISVARNAAIDAGAELADWLVMIDDDCLPDTDWVRQLLLTKNKTAADCVSGRCLDEALPGAPAWLTDEHFLSGFSAPIDGQEIPIGPLKNTMISADFLRNHDIRFDLAFGTVGGEDVMFFHSCHRAGVTQVYSDGAVVREPVPLERSTLKYQLERRLWYGNTEAVTSIASGRASRVRMAASGGKLVVTTVQPLAAALLGRRRPAWRYALAQLLQGTGRLIGSAGLRIRHH